MHHGKIGWLIRGAEMHQFVDNYAREKEVQETWFLVRFFWVLLPAQEEIPPPEAGIRWWCGRDFYKECLLNPLSVRA